MKAIAIAWALWIGTPDELGVRIAAYPTLAACQVAAYGMVPATHASWAHCVPEEKG